MVSEAKQVGFGDHNSGRGKRKQNKRLIMQKKYNSPKLVPTRWLGNPGMPLNIPVLHGVLVDANLSSWPLGSCPCPVAKKLQSK